MTIALTGTGGLFTRTGREIGLLNTINTARASTFTGYLNDIQAEYLAADQDVIAQLFTQGASWVSVQNGFQTYLRTIATDTINAMVTDDTDLNNPTLTQSLTELIRQMYVSSSTVNKPTVSASVAYGNGIVSNTGTGKGVASVTNEFGVQNDYCYAEAVRLICSNDAQTGTATAGQEVFTILAEAAVTNMLSADWPAGSGATGTVTCVNASESEDTTSNLLVNSDFEAFTANLPDDWIKVTGTAGTNIQAGGSAAAYIGTNCLELPGDAATLVKIYQQFATAGQSTAVIAPETVYSMSVWMKATAGSTGVVKFSLQDSTYTVINDDQGTANTVSVNLNTLSTSYAQTSVFFRLPKALPSVVRLVVELTTAINAAHSLYIDELVLQEATQLYSGGPYVAINRGSVNWIKGDQITVTVSNNYGGAFQKGFQRMFNMAAKNLVIPSSGAPTISDSLVAP